MLRGERRWQGVYFCDEGAYRNVFVMGRDMLKVWVGYNLGQDFINIFLLVLCKTNL